MPVAGTVRVGEEPLASGTIRFVPTGATVGPVASGSVVAGRYELSAAAGPVAGPHRVEVVGGNLGFALEDEDAARAYGASHRGKPPAAPVPPGYGGGSPLTADIPPGGAEALDFCLERK